MKREFENINIIVVLVAILKRNNPTRTYAT